MRPPAKIKPWLNVQEMYNWLENAPDEDSYKRRHTIWLTHTDKLHARKIADILGVSIQAVWLWVKQYNESGPQGLKRKGRGGRRWGFLSQKEEAEFMKPFIQRARSNKPSETAHIQALIEKKLGKKVSKAYVYSLLQRHDIYSIIAQSKISTAISTDADSFKKLSQPWHKQQ